MMMLMTDNFSSLWVWRNKQIWGQMPAVLTSNEPSLEVAVHIATSFLSFYRVIFRQLIQAMPGILMGTPLWIILRMWVSSASRSIAEAVLPLGLL